MIGLRFTPELLTALGVVMVVLRGSLALLAAVGVVVLFAAARRVSTSGDPRRAAWG